MGEDENALFYVSGSKRSQREKMGLEKKSKSLDGDQHMKQKGDINCIKGKNRVNDLCKKVQIFGGLQAAINDIKMVCRGMV